MSLVAAGCLTLLAILIALGILIRNVIIESDTGSDSSRDSVSVNLEYPDKEILFEVGLIADTENDWDSMTKAIEYMANNPQIDHVFHLGDITQLGVLEDLQKAKDIADSFDIEFYAVPGDRDLWKSKGIEGFQSVFGDSYRMVEVNETRFMLIDNSNEYEGINQAQWQFISQNIDNTDFVILHNPIYFGQTLLGLVGKGMGQYSEEVSQQRLELLDIIRNSNVSAVLAGDQHVFSVSEDSEKSDLVHYVIGAANLDRNIYRPNFAVMKIYEDGTVYVEQIVL